MQKIAQSVHTVSKPLSLSPSLSLSLFNRCPQKQFSFLSFSAVLNYSFFSFFFIFILSFSLSILYFPSLFRLSLLRPFSLSEGSLQRPKSASKCFSSVVFRCGSERHCYFPDWKCCQSNLTTATTTSDLVWRISIEKTFFCKKVNSFPAPKERKKNFCEEQTGKSLFVQEKLKKPQNFKIELLTRLETVKNGDQILCFK